MQAFRVYGDPTIHPQTDGVCGNVNPIGFRSCYDDGKRCEETLFLTITAMHDLRIKVARIFNTYGPRMHPWPRGIGVCRRARSIRNPTRMHRRLLKKLRRRGRSSLAGNSPQQAPGDMVSG